MDFLKDNKLVLTTDPRREAEFRDWALRLCGIESDKPPRWSAGGYSFAEREAFRTAVEKMLD